MNVEKNMIGTNLVAQIALVVNNVEKTAQTVADFFGLENPPLIVTNDYELTGAKYLGEPTKTKAKIKVFHVGPNLDLELLEPNDEPSTWRDELNKNGEGLHHLGFRIQGMDQLVEKMEANGFKLIQKGLNGNMETSYAYFDTKNELKFMVELLGK